MEEEKKLINAIEQVVKAATLIYGFLVFCGALYFHFYYKTFHINIFRYLDVAEISISFLHIIIQSIIFIGTPICIVFLAKSIFEIRKVIFHFNEKKLPLTEKQIIAKTKKSHLIKAVQYIWIIVAFATCGIYLYLSSIRLSVSFHFPPNRNITWSLFLTLSAGMMILKYDLRFIIINAMIIFIMASVYNAITDIKFTLENAKNTTVTIITKDNDTISTNSKYYFVGRTSNYVFLYNSTDSTNDDIPVGEIKKISYK